MLSNDSWYNMPQRPQDVEEVANPAQDTITNLIVCVKATQTVTAIRSLANRLNRDSNILFLQNGAGMIDEVNRHLFPDPISLPNYMIGVISHGVTLNEPFDITHTGFSATSIGPVPRDHTKIEDIPSSQSKYLLDVLPQSQILNATSYRYIDILQIQLEKLTVNAFCNPICALNDAKNEFLFTVPELRRSLLEEISQVVLAFPELKGVPGLEERFSVERLESTVNTIIQKTSQTTYSMVWDLRAGRETEVKFINGFWSRLGQMTGVKTPVNDDLVCQILAKSAKNGNREMEVDHK